ncbi:RiPP maturation radical SAM protein 1 [Cystobacter fuscus]|nr:RiPP maturation radical SAM protein 1 [Cystobacter fuscus]
MSKSAGLSASLGAHEAPRDAEPPAYPFRSGAIDMVFLCMPYASVERPSLALGTLAAALNREGITTRSIHANLEFMVRIGRLVYEGINNTEITHQLGEWTFSEAVFGPQPDTDDFIDGLVHRGYPRDGLREMLLGVRAEATKLVDDLAHQVLALKPGIVGCSSVFQQHCASLALLRRIREMAPSVVTMLGGPNCEGEMGSATHQQYPWVDFVVSGEADTLLPELCRRIFTHGPGMAVELLPHGVLGPASRGADAAGSNAGAPADAGRALIPRLDELPVPDFDDYFEQLAASPLHEYVIPGLPIETSRGCWWGAKHHCTFCGLNGSGMEFRAKSQERVREEVLQLSARYGIKKFLAVDNILDNKYFSKVLPFLAESGDMLWFYETKANLRREQVELLSRAGVRWIQPGIEALDDGLLGLLRKGCSTVINVQLLKWAYDYGIWVVWNHLHGAPGENPEWYERVADWLPLIVHLQPPSGGALTSIRFDRFSPYFNKPESFGLNLKPCWGYGQVYPVAPEQLARQAYFFFDDNPPRPPPLRLMERMADWASRFYAPRSSRTALLRRSENAPVLAMSADGPRLKIRDTRPCAVAPLHELTELEARVCHALDGALGAQALVQSLRRAGCDARDAEIEQALLRLVELKIVGDFGGRFLCLATDEHPVPYRSFGDFAGGLLSVNARRAPTNPEAPWDVSLSELFAASQ